MVSAPLFSITRLNQHSVLRRKTWDVMQKLLHQKFSFRAGSPPLNVESWWLLVGWDCDQTVATIKYSKVNFSISLIIIVQSLDRDSVRHVGVRNRQRHRGIYDVQEWATSQCGLLQRQLFLNSYCVFTVMGHYIILVVGVKAIFFTILAIVNYIGRLIGQAYRLFGVLQEMQCSRKLVGPQILARSDAHLNFGMSCSGC